MSLCVCVSHFIVTAAQFIMVSMCAYAFEANVNLGWCAFNPFVCCFCCSYCCCIYHLIDIFFSYIPICKEISVCACIERKDSDRAQMVQYYAIPFEQKPYCTRRLEWSVYVQNEILVMKCRKSAELRETDVHIKENE